MIYSLATPLGDNKLLIFYSSVYFFTTKSIKNTELISTHVGTVERINRSFLVWFNEMSTMSFVVR